MLTNGRYILTYKDPMVRPFWKSPMSSRTNPNRPPRRAQLRIPSPRVPRVPRSIFCRSFEPCWKRTCPIACWEMIPDTESCWRMSWNRSAWKTSRSLLDIDQLVKHGKPPKKRPDDCCFSKLLQLDCHILDGVSHGKTDCIFANDCTSSDVRVCDDLSPHETGSTRQVWSLFILLATYPSFFVKVLDPHISSYFWTQEMPERNWNGGYFWQLTCIYYYILVYIYMYIYIYVYIYICWCPITSTIWKVPKVRDPITSLAITVPYFWAREQHHQLIPLKSVNHWWNPSIFPITWQ